MAENVVAEPLGTEFLQMLADHERRIRALESGQRLAAVTLARGEAPEEEAPEAEPAAE